VFSEAAAGENVRIAARLLSDRTEFEVPKARTRKASIETDIVVDGVRRIAIKHHPIWRHGGLELDMEFESDGSITEFRVAKVGVEFVHNGAIVQEI
jgi:hypothetical protein